MADHLRDATKKMDFISRESAINALVEKGQASKRYKLGQKWELNGEEVEEAISSVPAADVRPVVRGHWTRVDYEPCGHDYICSECDCKSDGDWNFCHDCGAYMREV